MSARDPAWEKVREVGSYVLSFGSYYAFVQLALAYRWDLRQDALGALTRTIVGSEKKSDTDDGKPSPRVAIKPTSPAESFRSRGAMLLFCVIGIQTSYLCWGGPRTLAAARGLLPRADLPSHAPLPSLFCPSSLARAHHDTAVRRRGGELQVV